VNSAFWLSSPSLNASLSIRTCKELIVLTKDAQIKGAQQNAYANTANALTTPFRYQGKAITNSAPMNPNHVVRTVIGWRRNVDHSGRKRERTEQVERPAKQWMDGPWDDEEGYGVGSKYGPSCHYSQKGEQEHSVFLHSSVVVHLGQARPRQSGHCYDSNVQYSLN